MKDDTLDDLEEWDKISKCYKCGKDMEMDYDSIQKKISKYTWKPTCKCYPNNFRLGIL